MMRTPSYRDNDGWRAYQEFFRSELRSENAPAVREEWWTFAGMNVHLDRVPSPGASAKLLLLHGGGSYGRLFAPYAAIGARAGFETLAPDLPGYGLTDVGGRVVDYPLWVDCAAALIEAERARDDRPIVVLGASMGGMLAYSAAARAGAAGVIATCLLDTRVREVRAALARSPRLADTAMPIVSGLRAVLDPLRVPIKWLSNMSAISNDPAIAAICAADPLGGGARVSVRFLRTYLASVPEVEPEDFTACPVMVAHPEDDRWTPPALTRPFFDRLACTKRWVGLPGAGHFPTEDHALRVLERAASDFLGDAL